MRAITKCIPILYDGDQWLSVQEVNPIIDMRILQAASSFRLSISWPIGSGPPISKYVMSIHVTKFISTCGWNWNQT
jgi:hypothetical protein